METHPNAANATAVVGIEVRHVLAFPAGAVATDALVPGILFIEGESHRLYRIGPNRATWPEKLFG